MIKSSEFGESRPPLHDILLKPVRGTINFVREHPIASAYLALWLAASVNTVTTVVGTNIETSNVLTQMGITVSDPLYESTRSEVLNGITATKSPLLEVSAIVMISMLPVGGMANAGKS